MLAVQRLLIVEEGALAVGQVAKAPDQGPRSRVSGDLGRPHAERVGRVAVDARAHRVCQGKRPEALGHAETGRARVPASGGDHDHAVRCLRAVDRRSRRALQDLDVLDVVRVQVGDAVDRVVLARRVTTGRGGGDGDRKSTRLNSSHSQISYAVFCLKKKKTTSCSHLVADIAVWRLY